MTEPSDLSREDIQALYDNLKTNLGDRCFVKAELASVRDGMPPGMQAVVTPERYAEEVALGHVPAEQRLNHQAIESLVAHCGARNERSLGSDFSNATGQSANLGTLVSDFTLKPQEPFS